MSEEYARATCAFAIRVVMEGKRVVPTREKEVALLVGSHKQEKTLAKSSRCVLCVLCGSVVYAGS